MRYRDIAVSKELIQQCRNVVSSGEGREVFKLILMTTLFFEQADNDEERGLKNWSSWFVNLIANNDPYGHVDDFIRLMTRQPLKKESRWERFIKWIKSFLK